ncbi:MAG: pyridoxamine 5'-phosphate oxidase family protein [Chloroflexi bacterium]|nr:pyridoxamine 5'-phosphate oxidase family protein [Chloroflexota bacterium]
MPKNTNSQALNTVRRSDRAVNDDAWIRQQLHAAAVGILALSDGKQPFINTNIFVYNEKEHAIYLHTAGRGQTRSVVESNANVCFSVFDMGRLLPADIALEFSVEYSSVVVFGKASVIEEEEEEEEEATTALQALLDKYFPHLRPGKDYRPPVPEELKRTSVFRLDIESWSGKQKKVEEDFPGAFMYGDAPL